MEFDEYGWECETNFVRRLDLALEGHRKLAEGKRSAAPGNQPETISPRPGRWKLDNFKPNSYLI